MNRSSVLILCLATSNATVLTESLASRGESGLGSEFASCAITTQMLSITTTVLAQNLFIKKIYYEVPIYEKVAGCWLSIFQDLNTNKIIELLSCP
jgi:hypothetical protein